jgi:hypothetical protein
MWLIKIGMSWMNGTDQLIAVNILNVILKIIQREKYS